MVTRTSRKSASLCRQVCEGVWDKRASRGNTPTQRTTGCERTDRGKARSGRSQKKLMNTTSVEGFPIAEERLAAPYVMNADVVTRFLGFYLSHRPGGRAGCICPLSIHEWILLPSPKRPAEGLFYSFHSIAVFVYFLCSLKFSFILQNYKGEEREM